MKNRMTSVPAMTSKVCTQCAEDGHLSWAEAVMTRSLTGMGMPKLAAATMALAWQASKAMTRSGVAIVCSEAKSRVCCRPLL